jgi:hypothetical protein
MLVATLALPRIVVAPLLAMAMVYVTGETSPGQTAVCKRTKGSMENSHQTRNDETIRWRARWTGDDCSIDLLATGEIRFNSDFTDIMSVGNGGLVDITEVQGNTMRRLMIRHDRVGLTRTFFVNGRDQPWDDAARRWLADLLIDLDRSTAIGVTYRYPLLYANGGAKAVIDEVEQMTGDYARSVYLRRLIESANLGPAEYERVVTVTSRDMSSDYEISRILRSVGERSSLDNGGMRAAYLRAVERMSSDYERSRVLQTIVTKSNMSREVGQAAIRTATTFSSDYERSRVLLAAIANKALDVDDAIPILETVTKSSSDYEKSRVMQAVAARWAITGEARKAYLRAADTIKSDYENRRVLAALINQEVRY